MKLALFDFDGTITTKDSLAEFIKFAVGKPKYFLGLFLQSPSILGYLLKLKNNSAAKESLISHFFKDWSYDVFKEIADKYSLEGIDSIVRPQAMDKIQWHKDEGHQVVIVSASIDCWLKKWCEKHDLELVSTQLEVKDGKLTGKFLNQNCHGLEKINKVKERYELEEYQFIYAYGDSAGDKPLMALAHESYYKPFRGS